MNVSTLKLGFVIPNMQLYFERQRQETNHLDVSFHCDFGY